ALSSVPAAELAERPAGHVAVDLRRPRRPMADKIADLLQPKVEIDEPLHERVAQRMGAWPRNLDASPQQMACCAGGERGGSDGAHRRRRPKKHVPIRRFWSAMLKIIDDRLADGFGQWESRRVPCLALRYREPL